MYRAAALILVLVVAVVFFAAQLAEVPVRALQKAEVRPAPEAFETAGASGAEGGDAVGPAPNAGDLKIGDFDAPERVPDYKVLDKSLDTRDGARAVRLLIDTRAREEEYFVLIARDLKSRYADYDAVSVQFTDTEDLLFYNDDPQTRDLLAYYGGALIFNTYDGAYYLGYVYGPPNMDGYYVKAAD
ncbi:MAG TPA: hypothetical protein VFH16_16915 [Rubrobacter sp.]|nr:hypothetical protein [Rubrobacter sp.]